MKKTISLILMFLLCFGLCACGENTAPATTEPGVQDPAADVPSVLLPYLEALYGKWTLTSTDVADQNPYAALEVRKDGTCTADGVEYTWTFDSKYSNNTNLIIKIYRGSEHICGAQVSRSLDGSIYYFRAVDEPLIFCPGVWEKGE